MKKIWSLFAMAVVCTVSSCGGGSGSTTRENTDDTCKENKVKEVSGKMTTEKANEIIQYYNASLAVFKKEYKEDYREKVLKYMANRKLSRTTHAPIIPKNINGRESKKVMQPGDCFTSQTRETLEEGFKSYMESGKKFFENYDAYKAYIKAEDYKDDNWAKGNELLAENQKLSEGMEATKQIIYSLLSPLADAAEAMNLADNPLKDYILLSKQIFGTMEELAETCAQDPVDVEQLDKEYASLEETVKKARALEPVANYGTQVTRYGKFLDDVEGFMGTIRKARRENKFNKRSYDEMTRSYNLTINSYNRFVN